MLLVCKEMIKTIIKKVFRTEIVGRYAQFALDVNRNENNGNIWQKTASS